MPPAAGRSDAAHQLRLEPLCQMCLNRGRITAATVVDHVEPHRDDPVRFWTGKVQSLCASCHSGPKASIEKRGYDTRIGPDGWPTDPRASGVPTFEVEPLTK